MADQSRAVVRRSPSPVFLMDKSALLDPRISVSAKGVLAVYACLEDDLADVDEVALAEACGLDLGALGSHLAELESAGHIATGVAAEIVAIDAAEAQRREAELLRNSKASKAASSSSVVYYLRRRDGAIKIGFSKQLGRRLGVLTDQHGPLVLLGAERGGYHLEAERHAQFAPLRIRPDREWFHPGDVLLQHLRSIADRYDGLGVEDWLADQGFNRRHGGVQ